jgi:hypothetical protein
MSFAHFDEIYDICSGMMEEEEVLMKAKPPIEQLEVMNGRIPEAYRWWEEAVREIEEEKERELLYV